MNRYRPPTPPQNEIDLETLSRFLKRGRKEKERPPRIVQCSKNPPLVEMRSNKIDENDENGGLDELADCINYIINHFQSQQTKDYYILGCLLLMPYNILMNNMIIKDRNMTMKTTFSNGQTTSFKLIRKELPKQPTTKSPGIKLYSESILDNFGESKNICKLISCLCDVADTDLENRVKDMNLKSIDIKDVSYDGFSGIGNERNLKKMILTLERLLKASKQLNYFMIIRILLLGFSIRKMHDIEKSIYYIHILITQTGFKQVCGFGENAE
nr:5531_t:CDS:1 [Entrophospora candida]